MTKLLAISGSLRKASFNTALLRAATEMAPEGVEITKGSIRGIPLYDGDEEAATGVPEAVTRLQDQIAQADGLLFFTPEYNNGVPGVFKNAVDWVSRPSTSHPRQVFQGKSIAITGASPGFSGTLLSQEAWLPTVRSFGMVPWFGVKLMVSNAKEAIMDGRIVDEAVSQRLRDFVEGFATFVAARQASDGK